MQQVFIIRIILLSDIRMIGEAKKRRARLMSSRPIHLENSELKESKEGFESVCKLILTKYMM